MKILINTTASDIFITDIGTNIPPGYTYIIEPNNYPKWAASSDVLPYVEDGSLRGNDGIRNLPPYLTSMMLAHDVAENIGFNNSGNNFIATDTQAAIEEVNHFSYREIVSGKTLLVKQEQQMVSYQEILVTGELDIEGEVIITQ